MNSRSILLFALIFVLPLSNALGAAEQSDTISGRDTLPGYVGVMVGANVPASANVGPTASAAVTLGTRVGDFFGLGLFGSYYGETNTGPYLGIPSSVAMSVTLLTGQANVFLSAFHFGAEIGAAIRSWSGVAATLVGGTSTSSTTLIVGLNAGYDHHLSRNLSLGVEGHYFLPGAATEANTTQVFAVLKLWL